MATLSHARKQGNTVTRRVLVAGVSQLIAFRSSEGPSATVPHGSYWATPTPDGHVHLESVGGGTTPWYDIHNGVWGLAFRDYRISYWEGNR